MQNEEDRKRRALLFDLPYPFGKQRVYLPGLHMVAARLKESGIDTDVCDLDVQEMPQKAELSKYEHFGTSIIGPSSIPAAVSLADKIYRRTGKKPLVGGKTAEGLTSDQFYRLFDETAEQVISDEDTERYMGIKLKPMPEVAMKTSLERMDDDLLERYLWTEFSLPTDYGCAYVCDFCPAEKGILQNPRNPSILQEDVKFLKDKARHFGIPELSIYLGSLDMFQNPDTVRKVLEIFAAEAAEASAVRFRLQGLSRTNSFINALKKYPDIGKTADAAGLKMVSFGIDGTTANVWKSQKKSQDMKKCNAALDKCREIGITPGLLMVSGFHSDTYYSLAKNVAYAFVKTLTHGAMARGYLAKDFVPRNDGWRMVSEAEYREKMTRKMQNNPELKRQYGYFADNQEVLERNINTMIENPELFKNLDFSALGSELTHLSPIKKYAANMAYVAMSAATEIIGRNMNYPLMPLSTSKGVGGHIWNNLAEYVNRKMPFDR